MAQMSSDVFRDWGCFLLLTDAAGPVGKVDRVWGEVLGGPGRGLGVMSFKLCRSSELLLSVTCH